MKILALETSAKSVSAAVTENGAVLASAYQNRGLTHSVTLMPLIDGMLRTAGLSLDDIGLIAAANGPGSFTGLRIGVSAAKGLAWAKELPCCGVSTLAAMARTAADFQGLIIGAMDARRQQIYHALFRGENGRVLRVTQDCAISLEELASLLRDMPEEKLVVGDGAALWADILLCSMQNFTYTEETTMFSEKVHIVNHPLVSHKLTIMRDKNTSVKDFRELVSEIGMLITYEATRDLPLTTKHIETPICEMEAPTLAGRKFVVVPILRAGLGLVDGVLRLVPSARVGHIGMYRDEETLEPHPYFCKMPKDVAERDVLIVDPMLATGGSAAEAIAEMKKFGCKHIKLMVLVAAPEGIEYLQKLYPDVDIYAGAVDKCLNENGYIVPGLGDAGDRIFGTK